MRKCDIISILWVTEKCHFGTNLQPNSYYMYMDFRVWFSNVIDFKGNRIGNRHRSRDIKQALCQF